MENNYNKRTEINYNARIEKRTRTRSESDYEDDGDRYFERGSDRGSERGREKEDQIPLRLQENLTLLDHMYPKKKVIFFFSIHLLIYLFTYFAAHFFFYD